MDCTSTRNMKPKANNSVNKGNIPSSPRRTWKTKTIFSLHRSNISCTIHTMHLFHHIFQQFHYQSIKVTQQLVKGIRELIYLSSDLFGRGLLRDILPSLKFHSCRFTNTAICGGASGNKLSFAELSGRGLTVQHGLGLVLLAAFVP